MNRFDLNIPAHEAAIVDAIVQATLDKQKKNHTRGQLARRDVHSKSHGTNKGRFAVLNVPENCRYGLFSRPGLYDAEIRWSNGALGLAPDILPNIRGAALKVHGVAGPKLLTGDEASLDHDFIMANDKGFFVPRIENMLGLARGEFGAVIKDSPKTLFLMARAMLKLVGNPLQTSYFSQVPYLLGDRAVKYALIPEQSVPLIPVPNLFDRDYLRHAGERLLRKREVSFLFCVQFQREGTRESIEDSTIVWRGRLIPVGRLIIDKIAQQATVNESDGEGLSYNPWRVLAEHQPLGWPGRVRRKVYAADFEWRRAQNSK